MICPICKFTAAVDSDRIVKTTDTKELHKVSYKCRNPHCVKYHKECKTEEYEVDKSQSEESEEG